MAQRITEDITKTGQQSYRDLQEQNDPNYTPLRARLEEGFTPMIKSSPLDPYYTMEQDVVSPLAQQSGGEDYWGNSMFDDEVATTEDFERLGDVRAENQPWYAKVGAGLGKFGTTAVTTFLSGTVGIAAGAAEAIATGDASAIWHNDVIEGLDEVNRKMEDLLPNYYTQDEIDNPLAWRNVFSANFLGDKLIKNLGFAVGAFYGGGLAAAGLKATRLPGLLRLTAGAKTSKFVTGAIASTIGAVGEASIEAVSGTKDWKELESQKYADQRKPLYDALQEQYEANAGKEFVNVGEGKMVDKAWLEYQQGMAILQAEDDKYKEELDRQAEEMGDRIFLWNMAVLSPSNIIQHGKIFSKGIEGYRKSLNIKGVLGDYSSASTKAGLIGKVALNAFSESAEESMQGLAQVAEGNIASAKMDAFVEAGMDPEAERETVNTMEIIQNSIVEHFGSDRQKEEALLGGIIGVFGVPTVGRRRSGRMGVKLNGGVFSETADWRRQVAEEQKMATKLNEYYKSGKMEEYYNGLKRHVKFENGKIVAAQANDEEAFSEAEENQLISDIIMFGQVGRIGDLVSMVEHVSDTSDEGLESIIKNTSEINESGELVSGPFIDSSGNPMTATPEGKQQMIEFINSNKKKILDSVKQYNKIKEQIEVDTDGTLSSEQLGELIWLKMKTEGHASKQRENIQKLSTASRNVSTILALTNKSDNTPNLNKLAQLKLDSQITDSEGNPIVDSNYYAKKITKIDEKELAKELKHLNVDSDVIDDIVSNIKEVKKSQAILDQFGSKFEEYKNNPAGQLEHQQEIKQKVEKKKENKAKQNINQKMSNMSVSDINSEVEDLDELDAMLEGLQSESSEEEQAKQDNKSKVQEAKNIRIKTRQAHNAIDRSEASPQAKAVAHKMVDASSKQADSIDELLDTEGVAFNDFNVALEGLSDEDIANIESLEGIEALNDAQLEAIDLISKQIGPELEEIDRQLEDLPDDIVDPVDDEPQETTGHDATVKNTPINIQIEQQPEEHTPTPNISNLDLSKPQEFPYEKPSSGWNAVWKPFTRQFSNLNPKGYFKSNYEIALDLNTIGEKIEQGKELTDYEKALYDKCLSIYGELVQYSDQELKRIKAVEEYLNEEDAYTTIQSNNVRQGDEVLFITDPRLNKKAGEIVILMAARDPIKPENGWVVIGDVISEKELDRVIKGKSVSANNPGLKEFIEKFKKAYTENTNRRKEYNKYDIFVYSYTTHGTTHVNTLISGQVPYTNTERKTLNEVDPNFTLGIVRGNDITRMQIEPNAKAKSETTSREKGVRMPKNPIPGQPFLILSTGNTNAETSVAVPFTMTTYGESVWGNNSTLGRIIDDLLEEIKDLKSDRDILDWKDRFKELLSVKDIFLTIDQEGNAKLDIYHINGSKLNTSFNTQEDNLTQNLRSLLVQTPFQVHRKYINGTYTDNKGTEYNYNKLIGEIATVNLPTNTTHTINDWFVINPIDSSGNEVVTDSPIAKKKRIVTKTYDQASITGVYTYPISGSKDEDVQVDTNTWNVTTSKGRTIPEETANIYRAYTFGKKHGLLGQEYYDTDWGRYSPKQGKFIEKEEDEFEELPTNIEKGGKPVRTFRVGTQEEQQEDNTENPTTEPTDSQSEESSQNTQDDNIKKAEELGLLDNNLKQQIFSILSNEQQRAILETKRAKRAILLTRLESAFDPDGLSFDEDVLGSPINEFLGVDSNNNSKFREKTSNKTVWNRKKEERWLARVLPQLSRQGRVRIVDSLIRIPNSNRFAWGRFKKGVIDIYSRAASGTLIHEAFHAVSSMLLTNQERQVLYEAAKEKYGNKPNVELEEQLAEDFRRYVQFEDIPFVGFVMRMFRELKHIINNIRGNEPIIDGLFYRIQRGKLANKQLQDTSDTTYRQNDVYDLVKEKKDLKEGATPEQYNKVYRLRNVLRRERFNTEGEVVEYMQNIHEVPKSTFHIMQYLGRFYAEPVLKKPYLETIRDINNSIQDIYEDNLTQEELISRQALLEQELYRQIDTYEEKQFLEHSIKFLSNFGIKIQELKQYSSEEPLFDALNKVIYFKDIEDLTDNVGYAVAFMMQYHPIMQDIISYRLAYPKQLRKALTKYSGYKRISSSVYKEIDRTPYLKELGHDIAIELRKLYNLDITPQNNTILSKVNQIIADFFDAMTYGSKTHYNNMSNFARQIANNIKLNDYTAVLLSKNKPDTDTEATLLTLDQSFKDNPYEESIVKNLNKYNISLAGSASMSVQGTVYRPEENPMHDLDFNAKGKSKKELDSIINKLFPNNHLKTIISNGESTTYTYLVLDRPYVVQEPIKGVSKYVIIDASTNEVLGTYVGSELTLQDGVKGKLLDFFTGPVKYSNIEKTINGTKYLFSDAREALQAKIDWIRLKDVWDYNRFVPFTMQQVIEAERATEEQEFKKKFRKAKIVWGHPAIGKTTYLEKNQDILEWDQEVNPRRNEFIRRQIDPDRKLDDQTYQEKKAQYMSRLDPEYREFLTKEWEALKSRAYKEGKKLFASPLPLLKLFEEDFDLVINFSTREFYESNMRRGGTQQATINWKQAIDDVIAKIPEEKVYTTEKYFSELMDDYRQHSEQDVSVYQMTKYDYNKLSQEDKNYLQEKGMSVEEYIQLSRDEKEVLMKCKP